MAITGVTSGDHDLSIACWYTPTSQPSAGSGHTLIHIGAEDASRDTIGLTYYNNQVDYMLVFRCFGENYAITQTLNNGTAYHLVATYTSSTNTVELFVNGSSIGSQALSGALALDPEYIYLGESISNTVADWLYDRAVFCGGYDSGGTPYNIMEYVSIATTSNTTDFGDLTVTKGFPSGGASTTRGIVGAGTNDVIDYFTLATTGNASDFGDMLAGNMAAKGASSNNIRCLWSSGWEPNSNVIQYVTIASTGNATDFGDLVSARRHTACTSSPTLCLHMGGVISSSINYIEYSTYATTGNSTDCGDLTAARWGGGGTGTNINAIYMTGYAASPSNVIDYCTFASLGNMTDWGDVTTATYYTNATASTTRGIFGGGIAGGSKTVTIEYLSLASTGNASDFGDLVSARDTLTVVSGSHGGLQ